MNMNIQTVDGVEVPLLPTQSLDLEIAEAKLVPGPQGVPGGYYIPSVDEAGELSFTPSEKDMPEVGGANIRGPEGKSAYDLAKAAGYTGTAEEFAAEQVGFAENAAAVAAAVGEAKGSAAQSASSASAAAQSAYSADTSAQSAASSAQNANAAKEGIEAARNSAEASASAAAASATNAKASEDSAKAAQAAAEKARDEAQGFVGADYATKAEAQGYANTAEGNANSYTDQKIAAIPAPNVPTILVKNW